MKYSSFKKNDDSWNNLGEFPDNYAGPKKKVSTDFREFNHGDKLSGDKIFQLAINIQRYLFKINF